MRESLKDILKEAISFEEYGNITYGPHLTLGRPHVYIRGCSQEGAREHLHPVIKIALIEAFSKGKNTLLSQLSEKFDIDKECAVQLNFMNYGSTELVYRVGLNDLNFAVSINQPNVLPHIVENEFKNLERCFEFDPTHIVEPHAFFENGTHEMYASEFIDPVFCVAHSKELKQGIYKPWPFYHFEKFSPVMSQEINSCIIALLVNYYDEKNRKGISNTQTSGNDFILTEGFNRDNVNSVLPNLKLISARDSVECSLVDYVDIIRKEFTQGTRCSDFYKYNDEMIVNCKSKTPMTKIEIEYGIELGLELRNLKKY